MLIAVIAAGIVKGRVVITEIIVMIVIVMIVIVKATTKIREDVDGQCHHPRLARVHGCLFPS